MCGIVGTCGGSVEKVENGLRAILHRGPDAHAVVEYGSVVLGHCRLSVIDLDPRSDQPYRDGRNTVAFNGELFNYAQLRDDPELSADGWRTRGDVEVVARWTERRGSAELWDAMFALARTEDGEGVELSRDRFGEIPLHWAVEDGALWFASEIKGLRAAGVRSTSRMIGPGEVLWLPHAGARPQQWRWYDLHDRPGRNPPAGTEGREVAARVVRTLLRSAVRSRAVADAPVCTLLSGGIDSCAIAHFLAEINSDLTCYVAVHDRGSADFRMARQFAADRGLRLVEVEIPAPSAEDLALCVEVIEQSSKAQVEIAWPTIHLARAAKSDGFKVCFSGEGSDELWGSYGFSFHGARTRGFRAHREDLVLSQHRKNFARCNKAMMAAGVECRLPFLHRDLVEYALDLPEEVVQDGFRPAACKMVLRDALRGDLPAYVVDRAKAAFQKSAGLDKAAARAVANPRKFYRAERRKLGAEVVS